MITSYPEWAKAFKRLRQFRHRDVCCSINEVVDYYKTGMIKDDMVRRGAWFHAPGYRKDSKDGQYRGEQKIESLLFDKEIKLVREGKSLLIKVSDHNFPMTKSRKGQVICDAFGFLRHKNKCHPITIEVKVAADNVWSAVVESLIQ